MSGVGLATGHVGRGVRRKRTFTFNKGDLVLVKWTDGMVYFAKIKHIYHRREKCVVVFDDKSQDEADFSQIHSVDETTTDIICIKCKRDDSESPNQIVLCDMCGIGFHQKCHNPIIPASALQLDTPWNCSYCHQGTKCPFLTESLDVLQNLLSDDNESTNSNDEVNGMESEGDVSQNNSSYKSGIPRKKHRASKQSILANERRTSLRTSIPTSPKASSLVLVERKAPSSLHGEGPGTLNSMEDRSLSEDEDNGVLESLPPSRKRKKYNTLNQKRLKRSSVESHTVSVTRLDSPIFVEGSSGLLPSPHNKGKNGKDSSYVLSQQRSKHEKRSLHVSLSLPDEVEMKSSLTSPLSISSPPLLDALSLTSNVSSVIEKEDVVIPPDLVEHKHVKQLHNPVPFLASPLPTLDSDVATTLATTPVDLGMSKKSIRTSEETNPAVVSSREISAAKLSKKSVLVDEALCLPSLAETVVPLITCSNRTSDSVVDDDVAELSANKACFTPPCTPVTNADSVLSGVEETAGAISGSELGERAVEPVAGTFDGTTPTCNHSAATGDPTTSSSSVDCCKSEVSVSSVSNKITTSCLPLPPPTATNPGSHADNVDTKTTKLTQSVAVAVEKHGDTQPAIETISTIETISRVEVTDLSKQKPPVFVVPKLSATSSHVLEKSNALGLLEKSSALGLPEKSNALGLPEKSNALGLPEKSNALYRGKKGMVAGWKTRPSKLFIKTPLLHHSTHAPTPVITSMPTNSTSKPSTHSPIKPEKKLGQMTKLDNELSSLGSSTAIGIGNMPTNSTSKPSTHSPNKPEKKLGQMTKLDNELSSLGSSTAIGIGNVEYSGKPNGVDREITSDLVLKNRMITEKLLSKAIGLAAKQNADDCMKAEQAGKTEATSCTDPDVIITGVEPSKEATSRRASAPSRTAEQPTGVACGCPTTTPAAVAGHAVTSVGCGGSNTKCVSHHVQADTTHTPSADQRVGVMRSPPYTLHSPAGSRMPLAVHCRSKASTHAPPNSQALYYTSVNPSVTSLKSKQAYPTTNVIVGKPFAVVNALPMSSEALQTAGGETGRQQFMQVLNDGNGLSHIIPAGMLQHWLSPDSIAGAELMTSLPNHASVSSHSSMAAKNASAAAKKEEYEENVREKIRAEDIQSIQKKIGDAFNTSSVSMLMSAFNDAWEKFQANGTSYKNKAGLNKAFPHGTDSPSLGGTSQIQILSEGPHVSVPKLSATPVVAGTRAKPSPASTPQYIPPSMIHTASQQYQQQQQQYILQPFTSSLPPYTTLYSIPASSQRPPRATEAAGTAYPSTSASTSALPIQSIRSERTGAVVNTKTPPGTNVTSKKTPPMLRLTRGPVADQHPVGAKQNQVPACLPYEEHCKQWQQVLASTPTTSSNPGSLAMKYKNRKANKTCTKCGKAATFLCSGCRREWYCGRNCQLRDWDQHADQCKT